MKILSLVIAASFGLLISAIAEEGKASWYSDDLHGRKTASGEVYDKDKLTGAHPKLPFGTEVRVTILKSERSVVVRINDRCKASKGRIIDLSGAAARQVGLDKLGVAEVALEVVKRSERE